MSDILYIVCTVLICILAVIIHSLAIRLNVTEYDAYIKPIVIVALSFSEIGVSIIAIIIVLLRLVITVDEVQRTLPYFYCVKLGYVLLHYILSVDSSLPVLVQCIQNGEILSESNRHYNWSRLCLVMLHTIFAIDSCLVFA